MIKVILLLGALLAMWGAHRMALWLEECGWLYYRHRHAASSTLGNAFLEVQQLMDPGKRLVLEARREDREEHEASGEPPDKATRGASDDPRMELMD